MKAKTKILTLLAMVALFACFVSTVAAQDTNSYTLVKTSPAVPDNQVPLGSTVVMTAETSNTAVNTVVFNWYAPGNYPNGPVAFTSTDSDGSDGFTSTYVVNSPGQWTVNCTFERWYTVGGGQVQKYIYDESVLTVTTLTNIFVLPEYPLIGTAGIGVAMLLALLVFRKKQISNQLKTD